MVKTLGSIPNTTNKQNQAHQILNNFKNGLFLWTANPQSSDGMSGSGCSDNATSPVGRWVENDSVGCAYGGVGTASQS
jgi:hypothetical protein